MGKNVGRSSIEDGSVTAVDRLARYSKPRDVYTPHKNLILILVIIIRDFGQWPITEVSKMVVASHAHIARSLGQANTEGVAKGGTFLVLEVLHQAWKNVIVVGARRQAQNAVCSEARKLLTVLVDAAEFRNSLLNVEMLRYVIPHE